MILHVIRFSFKDGVADADVAACLQALRELGDAPSVTFAVSGEQVAGASDGHTHSAAYAFADIQAFERYMYEPAHRKADFLVHPLVADFSAFDIGDGEDADLPSRIVEIQQRRLAGDVELARLVAGDRG